MSTLLYFTKNIIEKQISENVHFLKTNSGIKGQGMPVVRNPQFYFKEGLCWSDINTTYLKCRQKEKSINDVKKHESIWFIRLMP